MLEEHLLESGMSVWVARPDTSEPRPAVMWLHERYGIVQHPKDMAERLAEVGYVGVSPDLFHRYDGDHEAVARGEARVDIRDDEVIDDFDEVIRFLRSQDYVRSDSIGIIGVCQTGRQPVLYAAHRDDVAAVVALYGGVDGPNWKATPEQPVPMSELIAQVDCPVLGQFGEADHIISMDSLRAWRDAFERANKSYRIRVYPGRRTAGSTTRCPGATARSRPRRRGATCSRSSRKRSAPAGTPAA